MSSGGSRAGGGEAFGARAPPLENLSMIYVYANLYGASQQLVLRGLRTLRVRTRGFGPRVGKSYLGFSKFEHLFSFARKQQQTFITCC